MGQVSVRGLSHQRLRDYVDSPVHNPKGLRLATIVSDWLDAALDANGTPVPLVVRPTVKSKPATKVKEKEPTGRPIDSFAPLSGWVEDF